MKFIEWFDMHNLDGKLNVKNIINDWNNDILLTEKFSLTLQEIDLISKEINEKITTLGNFEMIYPVLVLNDINDILNVIEFTKIIKYASFKLAGELKNLTNYKDEELQKSQIEISGENAMGYSGYDLTNQDGQFQKNNSNQKTNDKIRYYGYLNKRAKYFAEWVYLEIKTVMLRGIY